MPDKTAEKQQTKARRIALTVRLSLNSYDAITEIQRIYRRRTGRNLPLWKVLDTAIIAYAKKQCIKVEE